MKPEIARRGPLNGARLPEALGCVVGVLPFAQRFVLRGEAGAMAALKSAFGVAPPAAPLSSASEGARTALWFGPDEWLLIAEDGGFDKSAITAALAGAFHSLVDVSHRFAGLEISGERAAELLNFGVALDLDPAVFPVGMAARTLFVKAEITLWRRGETVWRMEVARSFASYVVEALAEAVAGLA